MQRNTWHVRLAIYEAGAERKQWLDAKCHELNYEAAKGAQTRGEKEKRAIPLNDSGLSVDAGDRGKGLQLEFTVEDEGVFTMPWKALMTYRRASG